MRRWTVPARVLRLTSPTTFEAALDLGWHILRVQHVRVAFVTPPLPGTPEAEDALKFADRYLHPGTWVEVVCHFEQDVNGYSVAQVRVDDDGRDYGAMLHEHGLADTFEG